jgi:excisionase family DNA binding protein
MMIVLAIPSALAQRAAELWQLALCYAIVPTVDVMPRREELKEFRPSIPKRKNRTALRSVSSALSEKCAHHEKSLGLCKQVLIFRDQLACMEVSRMAQSTDKIALSLNEAAASLSVSKTTLRKLISDGDLKALRIASKPVILAEELGKYLSMLKQRAVTK